MQWYFAYGSNMNAERLFDARLKPEGVARGARIGGRLDGWRLAFNKRVRRREGAGAGNIVPATGDAVFGTLNALPLRGFEVLDRWEGVATGDYERRILTVVRLDTGDTVEAIAYVALLTSENLKPTRDYLGHLLAGHDLLPRTYWEKLRAVATLD